jgi:hypothetical protein
MERVKQMSIFSRKSTDVIEVSAESNRQAVALPTRKSDGFSVSRRGFLLSAASLGAGAFLSSCSNVNPAKVFAAPVDASATAFPERIMLSCSSDPARALGVAWRAQFPLGKPLVQLASASASPSLDKDARTINAIAQDVFESSSGGKAYHYAAEFTDLNPASRYCYRVGDGSTWSEWNIFQTAEARPAPFKFIYLGDVQTDIRRQCTRVMRMAFQQASDARFVLYAGDLVTEGYSDALWDEFSYATSVFSSMIPALPTPGNHDTHQKSEEDKKRPRYCAAPAYHGHFHLPENGPKDAPELKQEAYFVDYQGVRLISVNTNALEDDAPAKPRDAQIAWLESVLKDNPSRWTIVTHHHPIYSVSKNRDNEFMRGLLRPLYDKYHVDLVLQGHDHAYGRTHKVAGDKVVGASEPGTVYAVSVSGPKLYEIGAKHDSLMPTLFGQKQLYQIISIDEKALTYDSFAADGVRMDGFKLEKDEKGTSTYASTI